MIDGFLSLLFDSFDSNGVLVLIRAELADALGKSTRPDFDDQCEFLGIALQR